MSNLELANLAIRQIDINLSISYSGQSIPENYSQKLINDAYQAIKYGIDEELISLDDVDDFHSYIISNLRAQIEEEVDVNKDYDSAVVEFHFSSKPVV